MSAARTDGVPDAALLRSGHAASLSEVCDTSPRDARMQASRGWQEPVAKRHRWVTDEPSTRGIGGMERMRLVRDDIAARVRELVREMTDGD